MLTANEYSCSKTENLWLPIPMKFSQKLKTYCCFFIAFLESTLNFKHFEKNKKKNLIGQVFLKLLTLKDVLT